MRWVLIQISGSIWILYITMQAQFHFKELKDSKSITELNIGDLIITREVPDIQ
jgi:myosin-crossreactive antigen